MPNFVLEMPLIIAEAAKKGVDPYFIAAIRVAENGGPGREFGVLSVNAATYADQLAIACATVRHRATAFDIDDTLVELRDNRVCYTQAFVSHFASIWAPMRVANDPTGLNANWVRDAWSAYLKFVGNQAASTSQVT